MIVMMMSLINLKHLLKTNGRGRGKYKGKLPIVCFHATRLIILLLGVLTEKTRMRERKESTKGEEITETTRKTRMRKVRNFVIIKFYERSIP